MVVRNASKDVPVPAAAQALAVEAWRRAEAMGLVDRDASQVEVGDIAALIRRVQDAGIARGPALRFDNVEAPSAEEAERLLRFVVHALEASPVARFEWPAVARVLDGEQLAALLGISPSSLRRYFAGERETPDAIAARLHHIALIVGDLSGAYNEVGVRRWFDRKRSALGGKAPAALLAGDWSPEGAGPRAVRELARSLATLSVT